MHQLTIDETLVEDDGQEQDDHRPRPQPEVWAQGDCVLFENVDPFDVPNLYRSEMAKNQIAISTHNPDGVRASNLVAWVNETLAIINDPSLSPTFRITRARHLLGQGLRSEPHPNAQHERLKRQRRGE